MHQNCNICFRRVSTMSIVIEAGTDTFLKQESDADWSAITGPITFPRSAEKRAILKRIFSEDERDAG